MDTISLIYTIKFVLLISTAIIALVFIILGIFLFVRNMKKIKNGNYIKTFGIITDFEKSKDEDRIIPVVEYYANSNIYKHSFENIISLRKGRKIKLIYNRENPNEGKLLRNGYLPIILILIGLYIFMCGLFNYFFDNGIVFSVLIIFIIVIIWLFASFIIDVIKLFSKKYKEVGGVVVSYRKDISGQPTVYFENIEYIVNGKKCYYYSKISTSFAKVGKKRKLKYNTLNPYDCIMTRDCIGNLILLIIFTIPVYFIVRLLLLKN